MRETLILGAVLALSLAGAVSAGEKHDHSHDDAGAHSHAHDDVANGYFDDNAIAERALTDWQGNWQSVYPLLEQGALDPVMAKKAEQGDKTAAEYRSYYEAGYKTDVDHIDITADSVTFHKKDKAITATYVSDGHEVLTYAKGNRGVRYIFAKTAGDAEAPGFIQFSDHRIAPEKAAHYHLFWGDDRAALLAEVNNWPTYYPASLDADGILHEMLAH